MQQRRAFSAAVHRDPGRVVEAEEPLVSEGKTGGEHHDDNDDTNNDDNTHDNAGGNWYWRLLNKHPLATKAAQSCLLVGFGDIIGQLVIEDVAWADFDLRRLLSMAAIGGVLVGPTLHFWYGTLARLVPSTAVAGVVGRVGIDQFLFAPCFVVAFFAGLKLVEGRVDLLPELVREQWWTTVKTNWLLWIPAQAINFTFMPLHLQVLFANGVALVWNTYLSYAGHRAEALALEQTRRDDAERTAVGDLTVNE
jgi:hypothetical protein